MLTASTLLHWQYMAIDRSKTSLDTLYMHTYLCRYYGTDRSGMIKKSVTGIVFARSHDARVCAAFFILPLTGGLGDT